MHIVMGYDAEENLAYRVAMASLMAVTPLDPHIVIPLNMANEEVLDLGFNRPYRKVGRQFTDIRDGRPFSTEFSFARFMVPHMKFPEHVKWVLWCDGDVMFRRDPKYLLNGLVSGLDDSKALYCVKHTGNVTESSGTKMGGLIQSPYVRKNWSSVMLWNVKHQAHKALTISNINKWEGRSLHGLKWLADSQIGEMDLSWNYIPGLHTEADCKKSLVSLVHFSLGVPMYGDCEFADEWLEHARKLHLKPDDALELLKVMSRYQDQAA